MFTQSVGILHNLLLWLQNVYDEETELGGAHADDTDSDDDDISVSHDEIDTSEDEGIKEVSVKDRGDLEWDDSTLTF
jgi:hypothetical protein